MHEHKQHLQKIDIHFEVNTCFFAFDVGSVLLANTVAYRCDFMFNCMTPNEKTLMSNMRCINKQNSHYKSDWSFGSDYYLLIRGINTKILIFVVSLIQARDISLSHIVRCRVGSMVCLMHQLDIYNRLEMILQPTNYFQYNSNSDKMQLKCPILHYVCLITSKSDATL